MLSATSEELDGLASCERQLLNKMIAKATAVGISFVLKVFKVCGFLFQVSGLKFKVYGSRFKI